MKEIRVKPLGEASKEGKIMVYLFFFQPILCLIVIAFMIYVNKELFRTNLVAQIIIGIFIFLAILGFFTNMPDIANGILVEEVCYIENKIFYYRKTRNFLGIKKVIKSFQIPVIEISDVRENEKKIKVSAFSIFKLRNSVEIETRDGKKYQIMNSIVFGDKDSQSPNSSKTNERTKEIFSKVQEMIKTKNTVNI